MEPELRGTLSAYARWAGISLDAAKKRNKRGQIVFCDKYPHMVDFVRSNAAVRALGRNTFYVPVDDRTGNKSLVQLSQDIKLSNAGWRVVQRYLYWSKIFCRPLRFGRIWITVVQ